MSPTFPKKIFARFFLSTVFAVLFLLSGGSVANAATLFLSPASSGVTVGNNMSIKVMVGTDGRSINNAEGIIHYSSDMLDVLSVNRNSSIFSLWVVEPKFFSSEGKITFNGGVPNPGFVGNGEAFSIVFRAKKQGTAILTFSGSSVRANDGLGTDVLTGTSPSTVAITARSVPEVVVPTPPVTSPPPVVIPTKPKPTTLPLPSVENNPDNTKQTVQINNQFVYQWLLLISLAVLVILGCIVIMMLYLIRRVGEMDISLNKKIKDIQDILKK